jgi:hypothetical protein
LYLHMEASQHSLLAACFTLHSINATLAIVPQRGAGLWISCSIWSSYDVWQLIFKKTSSFLVAVWHFSLAFGMMSVTNEPLEVGIWTLVQRWVINICTYCIWTGLHKSQAPGCHDAYNFLWFWVFCAFVYMTFLNSHHVVSVPFHKWWINSHECFTPHHSCLLC